MLAWQQLSCGSAQLWSAVHWNVPHVPTHWQHVPSFSIEVGGHIIVHCSLLTAPDTLDLAACLAILHRTPCISKIRPPMLHPTCQDWCQGGALETSGENPLALETSGENPLAHPLLFPHRLVVCNFLIGPSTASLGVGCGAHCCASGWAAGHSPSGG